jgi:hypothetical protein
MVKWRLIYTKQAQKDAKKLNLYTRQKLLRLKISDNSINCLR